MSAHMRSLSTYYTLSFILSTGSPALCPTVMLKNLHVLSCFHSLQMLVNMLRGISFPSRKCFIFLYKIIARNLFQMSCQCDTFTNSHFLGFHSHWDMNSLSSVFLNIFFCWLPVFCTVHPSAYLKRTKLNILFIVLHSSLQF